MSNKGAIIGAFLVGVIIASAGAHFYYARQIKEVSLIQGYYCENLIRCEMIHDSVIELKYLRSGDFSNAVERCERNIDLAIKGLAWIANDMQTNQLVPAKQSGLAYSDTLKGLQDAKKYRDIFPYKSGERANDNEVSNAFVLIKAQTNH